MDDAEHAEGQYTTHFTARIKAIRAQQLVMSNPSRKCWACKADTESDQHRWCSKLCVDAWSKEHE